MGTGREAGKVPVPARRAAMSPPARPTTAPRSAAAPADADDRMDPMALVLPFPAIDPVIVEVGPFALRWYALAYIAGILIGWWLMRRMIANASLWGAVRPPSARDIDDFLLWATLGVILGGRIGYVLFYDPARFLADPLAALAVWQGGMSFHGGLIGMMAAVFAFARGREYSAWTLFDLVAAVVPIGIFFGRIANFINGELWGRPTDVPWAMVFPGAGPEPRHPSQLYEAALEGVLLFVVVTVLVRRFGSLARPGLTAGAFAVGYGGTRSFAELFRMPDEQLGFLFGGLTMGMILSLPLVVAGAGLVAWSLRRKGGDGAAR